MLFGGGLASPKTSTRMGGATDVVLVGLEHVILSDPPRGLMRAHP
jgi:hypothetical protein